MAHALQDLGPNATRTQLVVDGAALTADVGHLFHRELMLEQPPALAEAEAGDVDRFLPGKASSNGVGLP